MDPLDEFEFKPLTEGLGFHKKAEKIKSEIRSSQIAQDIRPRTVPDVPPRAMLLSMETEKDAATASPKHASQSISEMIASLPPSLDFLEVEAERPKIYQPLSRPENKVAPTPTFAITPVPTSIEAKSNSMVGPSLHQPTLNPVTPSKYHERLNESFARAFPGATQAVQKKIAATELAKGTMRLEPIPCQIMAGLLDGMVVTGVSTLLMVLILAITRVNLTGLLTNAQTDGPTQFHIALLFVSGLQLYLLTARSFFGASLGEWAFDVQLGTGEDQRRTAYPMMVAWRTILLTVTGLVFLPLLSYGFKRDLLKYVTGLQTYQKT